MPYELIGLDFDDGIATLTLNDPSSRNGLCAAMLQEILAALAQLARRGDVRALVLTGAGKAFCSGANLGQAEGDGADVLEQMANPMILALQALPMPVVAAVNGSAAGAGMSLALAADVAIAARSAFFLAPFLPRLGILPDMGASWFLPHLVGRARTMGMILLGDRLPAERAAQWGLVWECVDDAQLMARARELAHQLGRAPAHSAPEARRAVDAAFANELASQLEYETERQRALIDTPAFAEGLAAFLEKREPVFSRPQPPRRPCEGRDP